MNRFKDSIYGIKKKNITRTSYNEHPRCVNKKIGEDAEKTCSADASHLKNFQETENKDDKAAEKKRDEVEKEKKKKRDEVEKEKQLNSELTTAHACTQCHVHAPTLALLAGVPSEPSAATATSHAGGPQCNDGAAESPGQMVFRRLPGRVGQRKTYL